MTAPPARPYSAEYALEFTWNSCTASWLNWYGARPEPVRPSVWPKKVLLLSAPSTTRLFSVPRCPAKLMSPVRTSRVTPGVSSAKSMKFRPLTGRFAIDVSLTVELTCDRVVSITGELPDTVTDSDTPEGFSSMRSDTVSPMLTRIPVCSNVRNPASVALTVYGPTGNSGARNSPCASVTASRVAAVDSWLTTTVTPGTTAPDASVTTPSIEPVGVCAEMRAGATARRQRTSAVASRRA